MMKKLKAFAAKAAPSAVGVLLVGAVLAYFGGSNPILGNIRRGLAGGDALPTGGGS